MTDEHDLLRCTRCKGTGRIGTSDIYLGIALNAFLFLTTAASFIAAIARNQPNWLLIGLPAFALALVGTHVVHEQRRQLNTLQTSTRPQNPDGTHGRAP